MTSYKERNNLTDSKKIIYCSDMIAQSSALNICLSDNKEVIKSDPLIDAQFLPWLESKNEDFQFQRVDSEINELEDKESKEEDIKILSMSIQSLIHLLAIGGINLPIHHCCKTGEPIIPPLGNWEWSCYYLPSEGFSSMEDPQSNLKINASEVALLQRLLFPELPIKTNGELLGPKKVWLKILFIIETWISTQLEKDLSSLKMLREIYS